MKKCFLLALCLLICGALCAQTHHNIRQSQARMIETNMGAVTAPIIGELGEVSPTKIVDTTMFDISMFRDAKMVVDLLPEFKQYALAKYCTKHGYDVIINALFQVFTSDDGFQLNVVVTGFPARYKRFRQATSEDAWMLRFTGEESDNVKKIVNQK